MKRRMKLDWTILFGNTGIYSHSRSDNATVSESEAMVLSQARFVFVRNIKNKIISVKQQLIIMRFGMLIILMKRNIKI